MYIYSGAKVLILVSNEAKTLSFPKIFIIMAVKIYFAVKVAERDL